MYYEYDFGTRLTIDGVCYMAVIEFQYRAICQKSRNGEHREIKLKHQKFISDDATGLIHWELLEIDCYWH